MIFDIDDRIYTFIPGYIESIDNINSTELIMLNDSNEKYKAKAVINGELIIQNKKFKSKKIKQLHLETFEEYNEFISLYDANKDKWIYNILDGLAEQDKILYIDNKCIIIPTYTWSSPTTEDLKINPSCLDKLHILAIPFDRSIRCIRDLTFEHIPLLKHMKELTLKTINNLYGINSCQIKTFIHYSPSTYHFHIHFVNLTNSCNMSSIEYSHDLELVLHNLSIKSDYYQTVRLNKLI